MLFRESVWYPNTKRSAVVVTLLVVMTGLHFTEFVGLMDAGLLGGWLPIQLAYDLGYTLLSVVVLYWIYTMAPDVPAAFETSTAASDPSSPGDETEKGGNDG